MERALVAGTYELPESQSGWVRLQEPPNLLTDSFGRKHTYLRVSITDRCNLRCVYCMPSEGIRLTDHAGILSFEEIERVVQILAPIGISKVRVTGGEPLVRKGVSNLISRLAGIPGIQKVALTTNATRLPHCAQELKAAGLTHLNVSLDSLRPERFRKISRRDEFSCAWAGVEAALDAGFNPLKVNMVVMGGVNDDEILDFVELTRTYPVHIRFIEYMPFASNGWNDAAFVSYASMKSVVETRHELLPVASPDGAQRVSKDFGVPGFEGTIGFITSMTEHFCSGCNRLRLLADGGLKTCLFGPPVANLRDLLRSGASDTAIEQTVRSALQGKQEMHPPVDTLVKLGANRMAAIGG